MAGTDRIIPADKAAQQPVRDVLEIRAASHASSWKLGEKNKKPGSCEPGSCRILGVADGRPLATYKPKHIQGLTAAETRLCVAHCVAGQRVLQV
jgi:hypothetical protein